MQSLSEAFSSPLQALVKSYMYNVHPKKGENSGVP